MSAEQIYAAIQTLPIRDRLRLIERVIHALAASSGESSTSGSKEAGSLIGMWADEPKLVDEIVEGIMLGREAHRLRADLG